MKYNKFFLIAIQNKITNIQIAETSSNNVNINTKNGKLRDYNVSSTKEYSIKARQSVENFINN